MLKTTGGTISQKWRKMTYWSSTITLARIKQLRYASIVNLKRKIWNMSKDKASRYEQLFISQRRRLDLPSFFGSKGKTLTSIGQYVKPRKCKKQVAVRLSGACHFQCFFNDVFYRQLIIFGNMCIHETYKNWTISFILYEITEISVITEITVT